MGPLPGHGQGREGPGEGPAREPLPWKPCPGCRGTSVGLAEPDPHLSPRRLRPRQRRGPPASAAAPACAGCDLRCTFPLSVASARHCSRPPPGSLGPLGASGLPRPPAPARSCRASRPGSSPPPSAFVERLPASPSLHPSWLGFLLGSSGELSYFPSAALTPDKGKCPALVT